MISNTPKLHTERLILRQFTQNDAVGFFSFMSDPEVNAFLPIFPPASIEEASNLLRAQYLDHYRDPIGLRYAICLKTDNIPIGYVNVSDGSSHDLGYGLCQKQWRKGIVTEACAAIIKQAKVLGIPFLTATHDVNNPRSGSVMKRLGFQYCYSYEEQWQPKDFLVTFRMYQLNLDGKSDRVYMEYWNKYPVHFIEESASLDGFC